MTSGAFEKRHGGVQRMSLLGGGYAHKTIAWCRRVARYRNAPREHGHASP